MRLTAQIRPYIFGITLLLATTIVRAEDQKPAPAPAVVNKVDLGSVTPAMVDSVVEIEASVVSVTPPREGSKAPAKIILKDAKGTMPLVYWAKVQTDLQKNGAPAPGDNIKATVKVGRFKETLQLQLNNALDLVILAKGAAAPVAPDAGPAPAPAPAAPDAAPAATVAIATINATTIGKEVTVQAKIADIRVPNVDRAPYVVTLEQDGAKIPLIFWTDTHAQIKDLIKAGNQIKVTGMVGDHKGTIQIKLTKPGNISAIAPPPAP